MGSSSLKAEVQVFWPSKCRWQTFCRSVHSSPGHQEYGRAERRDQWRFADPRKGKTEKSEEGVGRSEQGWVFCRKGDFRPFDWISGNFTNWLRLTNKSHLRCFWCLVWSFWGVCLVWQLRMQCSRGKIKEFKEMLQHELVGAQMGPTDHVGSNYVKSVSKRAPTPRGRKQLWDLHLSFPQTGASRWFLFFYFARWQDLSHVIVFASTRLNTRFKYARVLGKRLPKKRIHKKQHQKKSKNAVKELNHHWTSTTPLLTHHGRRHTGSGRRHTGSKALVVCTKPPFFCKNCQAFRCLALACAQQNALLLDPQTRLRKHCVWKSSSRLIF